MTNVNLIKSNSDNAKTPVDCMIRFDDDWITINGVTFSVAPDISEIIALLGVPNPDCIEIDRLESGEVVSCRYGWPEVGLVAESPKLGIDYRSERLGYLMDPRRVGESDFEPNDSSLPQRIGMLHILVNASKERRVFSRKSDLEMQPFSGTLHISGIPFTAGMTVRELVNTKQGIPLIVADIPHLGIRHASSRKETKPLKERKFDEPSAVGDGQIDGCGLILPGEGGEEWQSKAIDIITLKFEDWRAPTKRLSSLSLRSGEKIINCVHAASKRRAWFDAMLTNQRLLIDGNGTGTLRRSFYQFDLCASLEIKLEEEIVIPLDLIELRLFLTSLLFPCGVTAIPLLCAYALYSYSRTLGGIQSHTWWELFLQYGSMVAGVGMLVLAGVLFYPWLDNLTVLPASARTARRLVVKSQEYGEMVFFHGPAIRLGILGYDTLESFVNRLRAVVAKLSTSEKSSSESSPTLSATEEKIETQPSGSFGNRLQALAAGLPNTEENLRKKLSN